ncbi:hypothetical protein HYDPIDRAFT_171276 [Hydnomerulius pinastri MD-312]|uniref:Uncharacterized protein n=1 Tax=Hydnomerulius pinastri MD-312 TaxID=994086 RepID=A0A0C9VLF2_9AGAM|nr:hypothetical protein HYDPIDRAFT_171276 [Hydnomerulius pinastri MD-312]
MKKHPSKPTGNSKQQEATDRWLSKPGIRKAQNEKARIRMQREKAMPVPSHRSPRTNSSTSLQPVRTLIAHWKMEWASEDVWAREYNLMRTRVYEQGESSVKGFWNGTRDHASEGREIIDKIMEFICHTKRGGDDHQHANLVEACNMLLSTVLETKFFECQAEFYDEQCSSCLC